MMKPFGSPEVKKSYVFETARTAAEALEKEFRGFT